MKSHFWYNKRQRNGIFSLFIILISIQILLYFVDFTSEDLSNANEFALIQFKLDSLKASTKTASKRRIYPFNPNYLTDFKGYQLGLSPEQIDRLFDHRKAGKFINSSKEFQLVTGVSDSLLNIISPYFKFPQWVKNRKITNSSVAKISIPDIIRDLNKVNAEDLESVNIVSPKMAKRIIAYRNILQGFSYDDQLFEVYYLKKEDGIELLNHFKVLDEPNLKRLNINEASFKELLKTPYIDYNLTKKICQYRDQNVFFQSLDELKKIDSFPLEKFDRIALYLTVE